ncbi:uncharacterized protein J3R85_014934 [Psidium guajava]|nr:uncharacterized protein J3R85_014934 [Psidium guajava]
MISLNGSSFLNPSICKSCRTSNEAQRDPVAFVNVRSKANGRCRVASDGNGRVLVDGALDEDGFSSSSSSSVLEVGSNSTVGGGGPDVYGEDRATEDQLVTPWAVSVARAVQFEMTKVLAGGPVSQARELQTTKSYLLYLQNSS